MSVCDTCGLPKEICVCEEIVKEQQSIRITTTTRRYGKTVTVIEGIDESEIDIDSLTGEMKRRCATGGTHKDGNIELQGDHREKARQTLERMGYHAEIV